MAVKMRLSRKGRKKAPFYHIIVADARSPRDGKFIEKLGTYNPMTKPATIEIDRNAAYDWLVKGAQPTDTVKAILRFKGVYLKKHLMRGVSKGAMTVEQADTMWQQWIDEKENKIESRRIETKAERDAFRKSVSGEAKAKVVVADEETKEASHAFRITEEVPAEKDVLEVKEEIVAEAPEVIEEVKEIKSEIISEIEEVKEVLLPIESKDTEDTPSAIEVVVSDIVDEVPESIVEEVAVVENEVSEPIVDEDSIVANEVTEPIIEDEVIVENEVKPDSAEASDAEAPKEG